MTSKRKFTKLFSLVLSLVILFSITACGTDKKNNKVTTQVTEMKSEAKEEVKEGEESNDSKDKATETVKRKAKDTITIVVKAEPGTIDPAYQNNEDIGLVTNFIYDGLFNLDENGEIQPGLLETYEIIDDLTVKCKLREGLKYSNGTPVKAEDVFFSIERLLESPVSASHFTFIDLDASEIEDDLNFTLKFSQAWAPFMNTFSTGRGSIYSRENFEELGAEAFARTSVGTGPYKVVNWVTGTQIELTRNEFYWGETPKTENIIIKFVGEPSNRVIELETGQADIAYYVEGNDVERVNSLDGYHIEMGDSFRYFLFTFSMQDDILKNAKVREALWYGLDKDALVNASTNGVGQLINGFCSPIIEGFKEMPTVERDVEKAKKLLAEAGYPDGFDIELHIIPGAMWQSIAEIAQGMWSEIGVNADIVISPLATYEAQNEGKFQISIRDGNASELSNVYIIYESTFGSRLQGNDDWLDAKLLELREYYYGDQQRDVLLNEINEYLQVQKYTYPFMVMPTIYGVSDKLEGFKWHPTAMNIDPVNWIVYED